MYMLFCSVQIISCLDSQSKFQMFTLFSRRHVGVPRRYTNMVAPYLALSLSGLNSLKDIKTALLTIKRYDKHSFPSYMRVLPWVVNYACSWKRLSLN